MLYESCLITRIFGTCSSSKSLHIVVNSSFIVATVLTKQHVPRFENEWYRPTQKSFKTI